MAGGGAQRIRQAMTVEPVFAGGKNRGMPRNPLEEFHFEVRRALVAGLVHIHTENVGRRLVVGEEMPLWGDIQIAPEKKGVRVERELEDNRVTVDCARAAG